MKRNLYKEEEKVVKRQLERHKELVKDLNINLLYNKSLLDKQEYLRNFDDKWREYLRKRKNEEDNKILKEIEKEIDNSKEHIEILNKQLKEGVEIKKVAGVD